MGVGVGDTVGVGDPVGVGTVDVVSVHELSVMLFPTLVTTPFRIFTNAGGPVIELEIQIVLVFPSVLTVAIHTPLPTDNDTPEKFPSPRSLINVSSRQLSPILIAS